MFRSSNDKIHIRRDGPETRDRTIDRGSYELTNNTGEYWKNKEDEVEEVGINKVQLTDAWKYSGLVGVLSSLDWY